MIPGQVAIVEDWVFETKERLISLLQMSLQTTVNYMQEPVASGGHMPIDTGFLRGTIQASKSSMPMLTGVNPGVYGVQYDVASISAVIASIEQGDKIYIGYTANYAEHQEYGSNGREGRAFVRMAVQRWPATVAMHAAQLKEQIGG